MAKKGKRVKKKGGRVTPKGTRPAGFVPTLTFADSGCCSACAPKASSPDAASSAG